MKVNGNPYTTIWLKDKKTVEIIDQRFLPHSFQTEEVRTFEQMFDAIKDMHVRGAPLIGVAGAYGIYLASLNAPVNHFLEYVMSAADRLKAARPTAINLSWAIDKVLMEMAGSHSHEEKIKSCLECANKIRQASIDECWMIGRHGEKIISEIAKRKRIVNILTHCNAGWLACVDFGTATAPLYASQDNNVKIHVWVDETRPRNQGMLTAWELANEKIPHTIIPDNTGGHLMQKGLVDMVIVGSDRTTADGDVVNKIGTYLKALAAKDNSIPFYVALPTSTFDLMASANDIPIESRSDDEVNFISGMDDSGRISRLRLTPRKSNAANYAFDITPARLVTGLITEKGIVRPDKASILGLFPALKNG